MPNDVPSISTLNKMVGMCEGYFEKLIQDGCDKDVAMNRTYDALQAALGEVSQCYDRRDRLFESKLRTVAERSENA